MGQIVKHQFGSSHSPTLNESKTRSHTTRKSKTKEALIWTAFFLFFEAADCPYMACIPSCSCYLREAAGFGIWPTYNAGEGPATAGSFTLTTDHVKSPKPLNTLRAVLTSERGREILQGTRGNRALLFWWWQQEPCNSWELHLNYRPR